MSEDERFSGLSETVGANLAARRGELGKSLRATAAEAEVSPSHLSDIEKGHSQVSLPVLLRLVRALDLTVGELLPRIGGNQVTTGSINYLEAPESPISHPQLDLAIVHRKVEADETIDIDNPALGDLFLHVLDGEIAVRAAGEMHVLGTGDSLDTERLAALEVTASRSSQLLLTIG